MGCAQSDAASVADKAADNNGLLKVFVAGGTSNTGAAAINALLKYHPTVSIRAAVRDLKKTEGKFPADSVGTRLTFAVHEVKGNDATTTITGDIAKDAAELKGIDTLLIVPPQGFDNRIGLAHAYVNAAKAARVKHIVLISTPAVAEPALKLARDVAVTEALIKASGIAYTFLHCVFFYENNFGNADTIKGHGAFYAPIAGNVPISGVAVGDIGEAAANAISQGTGKHGGQTYWIGGPALSNDGIASVFSRVLGRDIKFVSVADDAAVQAMTAKGFPEMMASGLVELYRYFERNQFPEQQAPLRNLLNGGRNPTTLAEWLKPVAAAFAPASLPTSTVYVAGASGNTGSATVISLLKDHPTIAVRAGVRDEKKAETKFAGLSADERKRLTFVVHEVKGTDKSATLTGDAAKDAAELKGVDTLVLVPPQGTDNRIGVAHAYVNAAKAAGVKHIVVISTPATAKPTLLLARDVAATEELVKGSGVAYTFLQAVFFYENAFGNADTIKGHGAFYAPIGADAAIGHIAVKDIGEAAANAAAEGAAKHGNKAYVLSGARLSQNDVARIFTRVIGKDVKFVSVKDDDAFAAMKGKGFPELLARGFIELYRYFEEYGAGIPTDEALILLLNEHRKPTGMDEWLAPVAGAFK